MAEGRIKNTELSAIAAAIRQKNGSSTAYKPSEMAAAIAAIPTGGSAVIESKSITANGTYNAPSGVDGYNPVTVDVQPNLQSKTATENGTVTPDTGYDGLSSVVVNVSGGGAASYVEPVHFDMKHGYIWSGTFEYDPDQNTYCDVYQVIAGKNYIMHLGSTVGNRFRSAFFANDPYDFTASTTGTAVSTIDNPTSNQTWGVVWHASQNGYVCVLKNNTTTIGIKTYLIQIDAESE